MPMQQIMIWGHDFLRIRKGGDIQTFGPMGKIQRSKGEHIKLSTTHFVSCAQSFNSTRNWLSYLLHGMGKVWQSKFELEKPSVFGKHDFELWGKLLPQNAAHSLMRPHFSSS